ncbi:MliC family protein [Aquamicrobium sp. LC103]|uniref:MliC family protein n=1 Tax=Aquamicrobium sp. LC103 TaxID=1120658 RepID=UPI00063EA46B|nr:MliC family protein [Aquamicrobium sp. LC103]TKT74213.1 hypothetical protein XW59_024695 [Aquamicrobium sp. LC103]
MRIIFSTAVFLAFALPLQAAEITIDVPGEGEVERTSATYVCGDREIAVEYVNAENVSLAVLTLADETIVASNVIAASGAKYAGAQYVWWTKGDDADFYDLMQGEDADPVSCSVKG